VLNDVSIYVIMDNLSANKTLVIRAAALREWPALMCRST
jgi:hypothetical protein